MERGAFQLTDTRAAASCLANNIVEVLAAHGEIIRPIVVVRRLLPLEQIGMLLEVLLLQLVQGLEAVPVQAVATRGQIAPGRRPALVVLVLGLGKARGPGCRRRRLHVAGVGDHGHLLADLGDAVLVVGVALGGRQLADRASLLLQAAVRRGAFVAARLPDAEGSGLVRVGSGDGHDPLFRALGGQRGFRSVDLDVVADGARLLGTRAHVAVGGAELLGQALVFPALLAGILRYFDGVAPVVIAAVASRGEVLECRALWCVQALV